MILQVRKSTKRSALAVVEFAIVLPLLLLIFLATLEVCEGFFLRQKLEIAAQEGARVSIRKFADVADVQDAVEQYLVDRNINFGGDIASAVSVSPDPSTAAALQPVSVTVSIPTTANLRFSLSLYRILNSQNTLSAEVTMLKEDAL